MKNKSCKFVIIVSAVAMLLTGCNTAQVEQPPVMQGGTKATTSVVTTVPTTVPTVAPTTVPTIAPSTAPTTAPSTATTVPTVSTAPSSTEGTVPTTTGTTKPTTVQTTVTTTTCQHTWGEYVSNNDATCEKDGTKTRKCQRCGEPDVKTDEGTALGHNWIWQEEESYPPYCPVTSGENYYECSRCRKDFSVPYHMDEEMVAQYCREVEQVILAELNRYRVEAGQEPLAYLPRLSEVCQYRAYQIHQKSGQDVHNDDDIHEAFNKFEYGTYFDAAAWEQDKANNIPGYVPKEVTEADNYWTPGGTEAVTSCRQFIPVQNAEERGIDAMEGLRASAGHWSYLGSDLYSYVGIGVYCGTNGIYTNIWVCSTNYE